MDYKGKLEAALDESYADAVRKYPDPDEDDGEDRDELD